MWQQILDMWKESTIIQGILTLMIAGVWLYVTAKTGAAPDTLTNIFGLVLGFYFGQKTTASARSAVEQVKRKMEE